MADCIYRLSRMKGPILYPELYTTAIGSSRPETNLHHAPYFEQGFDVTVRYPRPSGLVTTNLASVQELYLLLGEFCPEHRRL